MKLHTHQNITIFLILYLEFIYKKIVITKKYSQLILDLIQVVNMEFALTKVINYLKEPMMFFLLVINHLDLNFMNQ